MRGRLAAVHKQHKGKHPPEMTHDGKKGPALSQGKTSGKTEQDYENSVGYSTACNKEDSHQEEAHRRMHWRGCEIKEGQGTIGARKKEYEGRSGTHGYKGDRARYKQTETAMNPLVEQGYRDRKKRGEAPHAGRPATCLERGRLNAPVKILTEDLTSSSPVKRKMIRRGCSRCQRRTAGTHPAAVEFHADRHQVDAAGGRDDSSTGDSDNDNALGNQGTGSGRETDNPVRHFREDTNRYREDATSDDHGHADVHRAGQQK